MDDTSKKQGKTDDVDEDSKDTEKKSQSKEKSTSKKKSPPASKDLSKENERLRGQVSTLQEKIDGMSDQLDKMKVAFIGEGDDAKKATVEDIQTEISNLRDDLKVKDAELQKNEYIDNLEDVSEPRKRELKRRVKADAEDLTEAVKTEISAVDDLIQKEQEERVGSDARPASEGGVVVPETTDARKILKDKDTYRKKWGLE